MPDDAVDSDGAADVVDPEGPDTRPADPDPIDPDPADPDDSVGTVENPSGPSHLRLAIIAGLVLVVALGGLSGWLGYRTYQSKAADDQRQLFLQVGRQGAINLTTLDYEHIDGDVQRILDSSTGAFYDDFQQRSASFVEVVKQVKSTSVGSVTEAGIVEPSTPTEAQVLVAVTVKSEIVGQPEQPPRSWRMRISVQKINDDTKVSNVEFVP